MAGVIRAAAALALLTLLAGAMPSTAQQPPAQDRRVLIVSIDGLRPDLLKEGDAPRAHALMRRGSFTFTARTVAEGYTVPSHVSMLTGVVPSRHGVTWDNHIEDAYPLVPTLFELARQAGHTTAVVTGKTKLIVLTKPGTLDWSYIANEGEEGDLEVAGRGAAMILEHRPDVMFVHLGQVDVAGHASGWGSPEYMRAVAVADRGFGLVEDALARMQLLDSTLIVLTADHGGSGVLHPPEDPLSQLIPWIAAGPMIRRNFDLSQISTLTIDTMATFATVCEYLGLSVPDSIDGKPVRAMFTGPGARPASP